MVNIAIFQPLAFWVWRWLLETILDTCIVKRFRRGLLGFCVTPFAPVALWSKIDDTGK